MAYKGGAFVAAIIAVVLIYHSSSASEKLCPFGTYGDENVCYEPHIQKTASFESSLAVCSENNGQLVVVDNYMKQAFLNRLALKAKYDNFWIEIDDSTSHDCFAIENENTFEVKLNHCDQNYFHICEFDVCPKTSSMCQEFGGKFYELARERSKYSKAHKSCVKKGGKLARINNEDKTLIEEIIYKNQWWTSVPQSTIDKLKLSGNPVYWAGAKFEVNSKSWKSDLPSSLFYEYLFTDSDISTDSCVISDLEKFQLSDCESYNYFFCQYPHSQVQTSEQLTIMGVFYTSSIPTGVVLLTILLIVSAVMAIAIYRKRKSSQTSTTYPNYQKMPIYTTQSCSSLLDTNLKPKAMG